ncbi:tRNA nucleotidyltransferase [Ophiocordyceps camponoti-floridani]|uniref:tRNA nucleotidyltransferase n=1 Tax=Ophiocordyceps camponoti-floridani TaxID=2030778 RepID=A0A8H4VC48_9HYPO|nr:tRNA nucleotidyltransferase [Ophiocordyceps camponoti-floridani]
MSQSTPGLCVSPSQALAAFILGPLTLDYIRSVHASSGSSARGLASEHHGPRQRARPSFSKKTVPTITSVLHWALEREDSPAVAELWPAMLPVLLNFISDSEHVVRIKGLQLLNVFISKCPTQLLESSGLSSVFEDAVFPSLYFLPGLDSQPESTCLLCEAYRVMLQIADAKPLIPKRRLLHRIIRDGILATYDHASKSPTAVQILLRNLALTVSELGIYSVKHLMELLHLIEL